MMVTIRYIHSYSVFIPWWVMMSIPTLMHYHSIWWHSPFSLIPYMGTTYTHSFYHLPDDTDDCSFHSLVHYHHYYHSIPFLFVLHSGNWWSTFYVDHSWPIRYVHYRVLFAFQCSTYSFYHCSFPTDILHFTLPTVTDCSFHDCSVWLPIYRSSFAFLRPTFVLPGTGVLRTFTISLLFWYHSIHSVVYSMRLPWYHSLPFPIRSFSMIRCLYRWCSIQFYILDHWWWKFHSIRWFRYDMRTIDGNYPFHCFLMRYLCVDDTRPTVPLGIVPFRCRYFTFYCWFHILRCCCWYDDCLMFDTSTFPIVLHLFYDATDVPLLRPLPIHSVHYHLFYILMIPFSMFRCSTILRWFYHYDVTMPVLPHFSVPLFDTICPDCSFHHSDTILLPASFTIDATIHSYRSTDTIPDCLPTIPWFSSCSIPFSHSFVTFYIVVLRLPMMVRLPVRSSTATISLFIDVHLMFYRCSVHFPTDGISSTCSDDTVHFVTVAFGILFILLGISLFYIPLFWSDTCILFDTCSQISLFYTTYIHSFYVTCSFYALHSLHRICYILRYKFLPFLLPFSISMITTIRCCSVRLFISSHFLVFYDFLPTWVFHLFEWVFTYLSTISTPHSITDTIHLFWYKHFCSTYDTTIHYYRYRFRYDVHVILMIHCSTIHLFYISFSVQVFYHYLPFVTILFLPYRPLFIPIPFPILRCIIHCSIHYSIVHSRSFIDVRYGDDTIWPVHCCLTFCCSHGDFHSTCICSFYILHSVRSISLIPSHHCCCSILPTT